MKSGLAVMVFTGIAALSSVYHSSKLAELWRGFKETTANQSVNGKSTI